MSIQNNMNRLADLTCKRTQAGAKIQGKGEEKGQMNQGGVNIAFIGTRQAQASLSLSLSYRHTLTITNTLCKPT